MNCQEFEREVLSGARLSPAARSHGETCPYCSPIESLGRLAPGGPAATGSQAAGDAVAQQMVIAARLIEDLRPVRPLASDRMLLLQLTLVMGGVGVGIGVSTGAYGWDAMSTLQRLALLGLLLPGVFFLARAIVQLIAPGSRGSWLEPGWAGALSLAFFAAILPFFPLDPGSISPVWNAACFRASLLMSVPAAAAGYLVLRRGAFFSPIRTGWSFGLLAGTAGALAVQLHCPLLEISHIARAHLMPVLVGGSAGVAVAAILRRIERPYPPRQVS